MSLPTHHPGDTLLLDYAGGGLSEPVALAVATHLALCPGCRHTVGEMEALGGAMLESLPPEELTPGSLEALMARLDEDPPEPVRRRRTPPARTGGLGTPLIPEPLRGYIGGDLAALPWRTLVPGMQAAELPMGNGRARLMRMRGGVTMPRHSHDGMELALVLDGGFSDDLGQFQRGDLGIGDESIDHRPVADPEGCLCLSVIDGRLRMTGPIGRFLNRFIVLR